MARELKLVIWPDYISPASVQQFEVEFDTALALEIIPSAVELMQWARESSSRPDVLCPPDYAVRELAEENRLLVLDHARLPNLKHIEPRFIKDRAHDPDSRVSIVKDWGTTGFMYREDLLPDRPGSWREFWALAEAHPNRVTVLNSPGEVIGAALKMRNHSYNSIDPEELRQARSDTLRLQMFVRYTTDYRPLLTSGEVWLSMGWNGDAAALKAKGIPVKYVIPVEGSQQWEDDWVIVADAPHVDAAYDLINFMLRPEIAFQEALYSEYATPNQTAYAMLDESIRNDPSIYPPDSILSKLEMGLPQGKEALFRRNISIVL